MDFCCHCNLGEKTRSIQERSDGGCKQPKWDRYVINLQEITGLSKILCRNTGTVFHFELLLTACMVLASSRGSWRLLKHFASSREVRQTAPCITEPVRVLGAALILGYPVLQTGSSELSSSVLAGEQSFRASCPG